MIEGPYSSVDIACDGRFLHLTPSYLTAPSIPSTCSSPTTSFSHPSPSSTSPSSFDDSPATSSKFLSISDRLSAASTTSSQFSYYPSPCTDISGVSSATSADFSSPCNRLGSDLSRDDYETARRPNSATEAALKHASNLQRQASAAQALPREQLQNPRRTRRLLETEDGNAISSCKEQQLYPAPPPSLVRQADRKVNFVDNLVDTAAQIVEAIWPSSMMQKSCEPSLGRVLPLRTFIQETLRRSRTSYSTLQVALYYLFVIRPFIPAEEAPSYSLDSGPDARALQCGRRMFLAALILASKYLQDKNYSARAWSKISGLNILEINVNELAFLTTVNWKLHISDQIFDRWTRIVLKCTPTTSILPAKAPAHCSLQNKWVRIFLQLGDSIDLLALEEVLADDTPSMPEFKANLGPEYSNSPVSNFGTAGKSNSMAFALGAPVGTRSICNENMPPRSMLGCDERSTFRCSRKSSLSVCETLDSSDINTSGFDCQLLPVCPGTVRQVPLSDRKNANLIRSTDKPAIVIDHRHQINAPIRSLSVTKAAPVREQVLGHQVSRPESRRMVSAPVSTVPPVSGKNRKRGNETPVASRHQKKQKDKLGEFDTQKIADVVPSGLTPQMRQMSTSFSISGKKGNGLRMNLNPGLGMPGPHGQITRSGNGQRSLSHVVYG